MSTSNKGSSTKLTIELQYASPTIETALRQIASALLIKKWIKSATSLGGLITLRFVNAAEGKKLNLAFRQKDYATNVLTFPYELSKNHLIADIIFCLPVLKKEAKNQGKLLKAHLAHLIVHGCLHAQGHDHEVRGDAKKMEALEIQILQKLGFTNPYC
jgi:probable rRNA maturation factor